MRFVSAVVVFLGAATLATPPASGQVNPAYLSITGYQFVSEVRSTQTLSYVTYRADLLNTGPAVPALTATLSVASYASDYASVVSGSSNLQFPPAPQYSEITSTNTFTILVDRTVNFS